MNRKFFSLVILPLVGMVIVLGMAYGFDILIKALKEQNSITYDLNNILLWVYAATNLLVNGSLLLLFWGVMTKTARSPCVGGAYLLVGIDLVISLGFYFSSVGYLFYRPTIGSCIYYAMAGMGMIGLFILILPGVRSIHKDQV